MQKLNNKIIAVLTSLAFFIFSYAGLGKIAFEDLHISAAETTSNVLYGDVNGDENIDVFDLAIHKQYLLENSVTDTKIYDLNGNGEVNSVDTVELQDFLLDRKLIFSSEIADKIKSVDRTINPKTKNEIVETQLTNEITDFVDALTVNAKNDEEKVLAVYNYLKNIIDTEFYTGSRKGAIGTFEQKSGNDVDQASLFVAIFRYLDITADYSLIASQFTDAHAMELTGTNDINLAFDILSLQSRDIFSFDGKNIGLFWTIVVVNLNGTKIKLDTAFKKYVRNEDFFDELNDLGITEDIFSKSISVSEQAEISKKIKSITNIASPLKTNIISKENITSLPITLPYALVGELGDFSKVTDRDTDGFSFVYCDEVAISVDGIYVEKRSAEIYGETISVQYVDAIELAYSDVYTDFIKTKNYNAVTTILKIGTEIFEGDNQVPLGTKSELDITVYSGGIVYDEEDDDFYRNMYSEVKETVAGYMYSIVFNTQNISFSDMSSTANLLQEKANEISNSDNPYNDNLSKFIDLTGKMYFYQLDNYNQFLSAVMGIYQVRKLSFAVIEFRLDIYTQLNQIKINPRGTFGIDLLGNISDCVDIGDKNLLSNFKLSSGYMSSSLEETVISQITGRSAVSTTKVLELAKENSIEILSIYSENSNTELAKLNIDSASLADIKADIAKGNLIIVPASEQTYGDWTGSGYISFDPYTDSYSFMLSGGTNGGMGFGLLDFAVIGSMMLNVGQMLLAAVMVGSGVGIIFGTALIALAMYDMATTLMDYIDYRNGDKSKAFWLAIGAGINLLGGVADAAVAITKAAKNAIGKNALKTAVSEEVAETFVKKGGSAVDANDNIVKHGIPKDTTDIFLKDPKFGNYSDALINEIKDNPKPFVDNSNKIDNILNDKNAISNTSKYNNAWKAGNGSRPDPSTYLNDDYINDHLKLFDDGASKFISKIYDDKYIGNGDTFVIPKSVADDIIAECGDDIAKIEEKLGLNKGSLGDNPLRIDISEPSNIRMPSGNEDGANDFWIPGGYSSGGLPEAVIDRVPPGSYEVTEVK
ncbi:hypothetical protein FACS1894132_07970 [Clostridia bacterium]|nr:hypothetical protein FACS1894132_07970 [Clostridia bacterium]